jgi:hypothetical protein
MMEVNRLRVQSSEPISLIEPFKGVGMQVEAPGAGSVESHESRETRDLQF